MTEKLRILLVEDNEIDVEAIQRSFQRHGFHPHWTVVSDGVQALAYLRQRHMQAEQLPLIILLDLNMPRMNGVEFLGQLRADPRLHHHIVFVVSTSDAMPDKMAAYAYQIAGYCVKDRCLENGELVDLLWHYRRTVAFPSV